MCIAGIQVTFDLSQPLMSRVVTVKVRCAECRVPEYEPLDPEKWYRISLCSFLMSAGDGYTVIANNARNHVTGLYEETFCRVWWCNIFEMDAVQILAWLHLF